METNYSCSYILPYIHSKRNLNVLKHNINQLLADPRIEIIVVECGKNPMLKNIDMRCKHMFVESETYNVGWLFNLGVLKATTKQLFFAENSILPKMEFVVNIVRNPTDHECIYAQTEIIELSHEDTDRKNYNNDMPSKQDSIGGLYYYTLDGFNKVGKWDENIFGRDMYSFQDKKNNLFVKLGKAENSKSIKFTIDIPTLTEDNKTSSDNYYDKLSKIEQGKLVSYIRTQTRKSANVHKYVKSKLMNP